MKRLALGAVGLIVSTLVWSGAAVADAQDFTIPSFEADYYLSRSADGQSHLRVAETIVAEFPQIDQNHGILRALPESYLGHSTHLKVESVSDGTGKFWNFTTSQSNGNLVLKVGDASTFVHGRQTYVIIYNEDYVTTKPAGYDGFFWDINGDQWPQTFGSVTVRIHLEDELAAQLNQTHDRCFTGANGSTEQACSVSVAENVVTVTTGRPLAGYETLTAEVGFKSGTFAAYQMPAGERLIGVLLLVVAGVLPVVALVLSWLRWSKFGRDPKGRGGIIPEYLPPKELSVLGSSAVYYERFMPKALSAQIVDLAVRHYVKIYEVEKAVIIFRLSQYEVEVVKPLGDLRPEEQEALSVLFGGMPAVGARVNLTDLANKLYKPAGDLGKVVGQQVVDAGYFVSDPTKARTSMIVWGIVLIGVGSVAPVALMFMVGMEFFWTSLLAEVGVTVAGIILMIFGYLMAARTDKGVEMKEYLDGLKYYMQVAEAERLQILQSPHGKLTDKVDVGDGTVLVKLYERVLPYAVLFGIEKGWVKEMAPLYEAAGSSPDWYSGTGAFNAVMFANAMSGFTAASGASFTAPSSSAGGGSAGGGGGGGGGGGW